MPDLKLTSLALLAPFLVGCFGLRAGDPFEEIHELTDSDTASTSTTTDAHDPPLTTGTVTGVSSASSSSSSSTTDGLTDATTADPIDPPPKIINFTAEPAAILQAAPVVLNAAFTSDVVAVDILDNGETIATVAPLEFPYERMITSDKLDGQHAFQLRARTDADLATLSDERLVDVDVPEPGTLMWIASITDKGPAEATAVVPYQGGAIIGGYEASYGVPTAIIRRLDAGGTVLWTAVPNDGIGAVSALALRPDGTIVVVGNRQKAGTYAMWMTVIDAQGNHQTPLRESLPNEWGTAATADADGNIYIAGYTFDPNTQGKFDAKLWAYDPHGNARWQRPWDNPTADKIGKYPDRALGVATTSDGAVVIAGETEIRIDVFINGVLKKKTFARAFAQRYSSTGTPEALWIDNLWPDHSGACSITTDPEGGFVLTGWTSDQADVGKIPVAIHLDDDLNDTWKQLEKIFFAGEAIAEAGGPSLEDHVILGSTLEEDGSSQIRISALLGGDEDPLWAQTFIGPNGVARLNDLTIDARGYIYFAGFSDVANGGQMLVGRLHP